MSKGKEPVPTPRNHRRGRRGPTVADVARLAGVSPMTVSRVVNKEPIVQDSTRERVTAAIDALGYVPNQAARNLAIGQQCRIALLYRNPSASYLSELLMGCLAEASAHDVQLVVEQCTSEDTADAIALRLIAHRIDAVVLPPPLCDDPLLVERLRKARLPLVQIATGSPASEVHAVTIDEQGAARAMTARLIALGHRRIGFIAGNPNQTASALRRAGYLSALTEAGIDPDPALIAQGDYSYRSGLTATEALLAVTPQPTAIFAGNDDMAAAAVAVAHRHRLAVPEDISVCGFDDTAMATTIWPELTTIHQPVADMARLGVRLLTEAVRDRAGVAEVVVRHEQLDYALVSRASVGPPGAD
jgi:LacI family transcriptional regulator